MTQIMPDSSSAESGQPTETPVESAELMGAGANEPDTFLGGREAGDEQTDRDEQPAADSVQDQPKQDEADPDTRAGILRLQDYTRKTQDLAEERKQFRAERDAYQRERQEWLSKREQALAQPQADAAGTPPNLAAQIDQALMDPNLQPTERAGLQVIGNMARELAEAKAALAEFRTFRDELAPKFRAVEATATGVAKERNDALVKRMATQYKEAQEMFGAEAVKSCQQFVRQNIQGVNPLTGVQYTIPELVGMATGKPAQQAQDARSGARGQRDAAKRRAGPAGAHPDAPGGAALTRTQALAEIASTF